MIGRRCPKTGTPYTLGNNVNSILRREPLYSIIPQFLRMSESIGDRIISTFCCSPLMRSIVSFEVDDDYVLSDTPNNNGLFFAESVQLTHIRITLCRFEQCVRLLKQSGPQLYSFSVIIVYVCPRERGIISEIKSISCPYLKQLSMTIYRNILDYTNCILRLLQCFSNVEHLTLLLAIGLSGNELNHFIDGFDLEKDIVLYMPHLCQFNFHIRSILKDVPNVELDKIRQSFIKRQQPVDCVLDYFNNNYGQCQIYSLPFIGTRLDFISNRFPLFDMNNTFSNVTMLLLFDDVKPFESIFFARVARALPRLRTLEVSNRLEQQEKTIATTNILGFNHLATLILFGIHMDYAEQLLCRTHLPCLIELAIDNDILLAVIAQEQQQARDNCSRVETLRTLEPSEDLTDAVQNFFPLVS